MGRQSFVGIALVAMDAPKFVRLAIMDLLPSHLFCAAQKIFTMIGSSLQNRIGGDALIIHDVAQPPRTAFPRIGEVGSLYVVNKTFSASRKLCRR